MPHEVGGSPSKEFNHVLLKQVIGSLWTAHAADKEAEIELFDAAAAALAGIKPKDEIEGMLAAQMVAAHRATMECYRRAMNSRADFEGRKREPEPGEQALTHLHDADGRPEPTSRQRSAEGHRRARSRPRRRPGRRRLGRDRG